MTTTPTREQQAPRQAAGRRPATWQSARDELLVRGKAHTREGDAIAAARRRLPMVELDGASRSPALTGPFRSSTCSRVASSSCTSTCGLTASRPGAVRGLHHHGLAREGRRLPQRPRRLVAVLTSGLWDEVAAYVDFMGYTQPWYSVRGVDAPIGGEMGHIACFLRDADRAFLTYSTTGRGNEPATSLGLLDMTPYGRREAWEDNPEGWPEAPDAGSPVGGHGAPICWYWRTDADGVATWGPTSRPVPQWTRPGATPVETLGRQGDHH